MTVLFWTPVSPALSFLLSKTIIHCLRALTGSNVYIIIYSVDYNNNNNNIYIKQKSNKNKSNTVNSSALAGPLAMTAVTGYVSKQK